MNRNTQARAIKALLESAADIARTMAAELTEASDTVGGPAQVNYMIGTAMNAQATAERLGSLFVAMMALQRTATSAGDMEAQS